MTGIELKYTTVAHLERTGNCYWFFNGVNGPTDKPRAIRLLNPGRGKLQIDKSAAYEYTCIRLYAELYVTRYAVGDFTRLVRRAFKPFLSPSF